MDLKDIKRIIEMMKANDLSEFELEDQGFRLVVKRHGDETAQTILNPSAAPMMMSPAPIPSVAATAPNVAATAAQAPATAAALAEEAGWVEIKSPIVGTFYRAPSPEADSFVKVGDTVDVDSVVCIVEAMKVMNEIQAEVKGKIRKVLVDNATAVEYGQPLFMVEPA